MRVRAILLAAALMLASPGARAADLVVWWEKGFHPEEDMAVRELIAAFEAKTGRHVELASPSQDDMQAKVLTALEAGRPPDFVFGTSTINYHYALWAHESRLADLADALVPRPLFGPV